MIGILGLGIGSILGINNLTSRQCMIWQKECYVAVDCEDNKASRRPIGLNREILENFKKITKADTLHAGHAGKVWYSKIDNKVEFFTTIGLGFHPVRNERSLKVATPGILEKHAGVNADRDYSK